jgi:simple sugar transport system permease protein
VILASIFFAALSTGGQSMQLVSGVPAHLTDVISGIIIFLVATKDIVQMVQKRWRKSQTLAQGKEAL